MMTAQWQQARLDELPKLYLSIVWKGQRVHAVDMGTQRHQNPHVPGATFAGQLVTAPIHQHFWISGFGIEYVEPVDISTDESTVFNFFIRSANLQIEGNFYHPEIQKDLFF